MRASQATFAAAMIGLGGVGLAYGGSSLVWADMPKAMPGRAVVIDLCSVVLISSGFTLLLRPLTVVACRILCTFLLAWLLLLKLPGVVRAPLVMVSWESFAEVAVPLAGVWCRYGKNVSAARLLFVVALPMIGLSHFAYPDMTASLVPKWMGFPLGWVYLTGAASIAAAAGMLLRILPAVAASLEAVMLWMITILVWVPRVVSSPGEQVNWSELFVSCAIAAGAWLVAETYRGNNGFSPSALQS